MTVKRLLGKEEERLPWWHTEGNRSSSYMMAGLSMQTLAPTVSAEEKKVFCYGQLQQKFQQNQRREGHHGSIP